MTKGLLLFGAPLALAFSPATALGQEADASGNPFAAFAPAIAVEPLTAEQVERLPLAEALVARIIPPGTMGEMMGGMFDGLLTGFGDMAQPSASDMVARNLGLEGWEITLTEEQIAATAALFDPAWEERQRREAGAVPMMMRQVGAVMEPGLRQAMAELYAIHFDAQQLRDIEAFFATPSGAAYASESYTMMSDPRLAAATMAAVPTMLDGMVAMQADMEAATADLPPVRSFADLSLNERKLLADLLGMTVEDLEYRAQWGAGSEAAAAAVDAAAAAVEAAGKAY